MLPQCNPNYKTAHRRFQLWCRQEVSRGILIALANELRSQGALDESECFIDASFSPAEGGCEAISKAKRENLVGDRAYDSNRLNEWLRREGIEMTAPHHSIKRSARPKTADGCAGMGGGSLLNASLHGYSGNVGYAFAGNTTQQTFSFFF